MKNSSYSPGNQEFLALLEKKPFDRNVATLAIKDIVDINQPILDCFGHPTTYLFEAQSFNNVEAVRFLFENGANPNFNDDSLTNDCPLYDLHFLFSEMENEVRERLEIVSLFFEYGADPNLMVDGETIYDHVICEVFDHDAAHGENIFLATSNDYLLTVEVANQVPVTSRNSPSPSTPAELMHIKSSSLYKLEAAIKLVTY